MSQRAVVLAILLTLLSWLCGLAGCHHGVYTPHTLPPELAAYPVIDVQRLDLSRMGGLAIRNEIVFPGDTIRVTLAAGGEEERPEPWDLRVGDNGIVDVPLVGPLGVAGLNLVEAERMIRDASIQRRVFRKPTVRVTIAQRRVNRVTVTGAVNRPDTYELPVATSDLAAALVAAGGLREDADRVVEIHRPNGYGVPSREPAGDWDSSTTDLISLQNNTSSDTQQTIVPVDLVDAVGRTQAVDYLPDGSTVAVRARPPRFVHLIGLTGNKTVDLPHGRDVRLLDALAQGGGPRYSIWIADKVKVIRRVPGSDETVTINVSIREAKRKGSANLLLASGDIVSVEENLMTFTLGTLGQLIGIGTTAAAGAATGLAP